MAGRGPVPNRSNNLSRLRDANRKGRVELRKGVARGGEMPEIPEDWHPIAKRMMESLGKSGQSDYYEESDWAYAYLMCEAVDRLARGRREGVAYMSAELLKAVNSMASNLLMTEGDRRRARTELEAYSEQEENSEVVAIEAYREMLERAANS